MVATIKCFVIFFCVVVALSFPMSENLCSGRQDRQLNRAFCTDSSFVLRAIVLSEQQDPSESNLVEFARHRIYSLKIVDIFIITKKGINIPKHKPVSLFVPSRMASLFLRFQRGEEYLLAGHIGGTGKLSMDLCDWHKKWQEVTRSQRTKLKGQYIRDCYRPKNILNSKLPGGSSPQKG